MDALFATFIVAFILIFYIVLKCYKDNGVVKDSPVKTMIVLGSGTFVNLGLRIGGHTSEMISLIRNLDPSHYAPIVFVHAESDTKSPVYLAESKVIVCLVCQYSLIFYIPSDLFLEVGKLDNPISHPFSLLYWH